MPAVVVLAQAHSVVGSGHTSIQTEPTPQQPLAARSLRQATLNLAAGQAAMLNEALKTDIFSNGMTIGTWAYQPR